MSISYVKITYNSLLFLYCQDHMTAPEIVDIEGDM